MSRRLGCIFDLVMLSVPPQEIARDIRGLWRLSGHHPRAAAAAGGYTVPVSTRAHSRGSGQVLTFRGVADTSGV